MSNNAEQKQQNRLNELEAQVAYQEDYILKLNDELYRQSVLLGEINAQFKVLKNRLDSASETATDSDDTGQRPPHY